MEPFVRSSLLLRGSPAASVRAKGLPPWHPGNRLLCGVRRHGVPSAGRFELFLPGDSQGEEETQDGRVQWEGVLRPASSNPSKRGKIKAGQAALSLLCLPTPGWEILAHTEKSRQGFSTFSFLSS